MYTHGTTSLPSISMPACFRTLVVDEALMV